MMKLSHFFLFIGTIVLLSQLSCGPKEDEKTPSPKPSPVVAIYPTAAYMNLPDRATFNGTKYPLHLHAILLPYNCPVSFVIVNEGPVGSVLNYSIADNGVLGGFLDYTNGVGSIRSGEYATITVTVDPDFTKSGFGGLGWGFGSKEPGSELLLNIYTPDASNFVKNFVIVDIMDYDIEVQRLCGIWTGTWSGQSQCLGQNIVQPVNGTWILNLQSVDLANQTATGTLTWNGTDVWWGLWYDEMNHAMPHYFNVDRTLIFNSFNTEFQTGSGGGAGDPCEQITFKIFSDKSPYSGEYVSSGYCLDFRSYLSLDLKSIGMASRWSSSFEESYANYSGQSSGSLIGSKSQ